MRSCDPLTAERCRCPGATLAAPPCRPVASLRRLGVPWPYARIAAAPEDGMQQATASRDMALVQPSTGDASAEPARRALRNGRGAARRAAALARCTDFACLRAAHELPAPAGAFGFPHFFLLGFPKVGGWPWA